MKFATIALLSLTSVSALELASCASVAGGSARVTGRRSQYAGEPAPNFHVSGYGRGEEYEELEFEGEDSEISTDVNDIERNRAGLAFEFGRGRVRGFFQVFADEFEVPGSGSENFEGYGVGGGTSGETILKQVDYDQAFLMPFRAEFNLSSLERDGLGAPDVDLGVFDAVGEIGIAYNWRGLQPGVGVMGSALGGVLDDPTASENVFVTGVNVGAYAGVRYKHPEFPLWFEVRGFGGNIRGGLFRLGLSF